MAIKLGSNNISKLYLGNTQITKVFLGSVQLYASQIINLTLNDVEWTTQAYVESIIERDWDKGNLISGDFYIIINSGNQWKIKQFTQSDVTNDGYSSYYDLISAFNNANPFFDTNNGQEISRIDDPDYFIWFINQGDDFRELFDWAYAQQYDDGFFDGLMQWGGYSICFLQYVIDGGEEIFSMTPTYPSNY